MRAVRNLLRYLTSLLLMFVLVLLQFGLFARTTLLNPEYYEKKLLKTDYYWELREEIEKGLADLSLITSIPAEILSEAVSNEEVNALSSNNILGATHFMKYKTDEVENTMDRKAIEASLNDFIDEYAAQNGFVVDDSQRAQIREVAEQVVGIVTNHTVLFNINAVKKYGEFQSFRKIIFLFYSYWYLFALAAALFIAALFALNPLRLRRGYLWAGSSMIASSLMTIIPAMLALLYRIPYRLNIATSYLKTALQAFTLGYIRFFLVGGFALLIIGLACLVLYVYYSKQAMLERRAREERNADFAW